MQLPLFYVVGEWAETLCEVVLLICSYIFCLRRSAPKYMRSFPVYATVNIIPTCIYFAFHKTWHIIYFLFTIFEILYFTYFLSSILRVRTAKIVLWVLSGACLTGAILFIAMRPFHSSILFPLDDVSIIAESTIMLVGCAEYIREIMTKPNIPVLPREAAFWMVCGIFCYFLTLAPAVAFRVYSAVHKLPGTAAIVWSFNDYSQLVSCTFYIIGMTQIRRLQKNYPSSKPIL